MTNQKPGTDSDAHTQSSSLQSLSILSSVAFDFHELFELGLGLSIAIDPFWIASFAKTVFLIE